MKLSVHQPHYHPWIGYIDKIDQSDVFVILDNVQFKKREFQNRNKVMSGNGIQWLTVPVVNKGRYYQTTGEVEIDNTVNWQKKHFSSIVQTYRRTEYFDMYYPFLKELYIDQKWNKLIDLNVEMLRGIMSFLGINVRMYFESQLETDGFKTERIVNICKALDQDAYLSGKGAKVYLDELMFTREGIILEYQDFQHPVYDQGEQFTPYLSIMDMMFHCGNRSIEMIRRNRKEAFALEYSCSRSAS